MVSDSIAIRGREHRFSDEVTRRANIPAYNTHMGRLRREHHAYGQPWKRTKNLTSPNGLMTGWLITLGYGVFAVLSYEPALHQLDVAVLCGNGTVLVPEILTGVPAALDSMFVWLDTGMGIASAANVGPGIT